MAQSKLAPKLLGKVVISATIKAVTGLRIGAATSGLDIGGVDQPVLRDPVTDKPYIPGSSLKGKLRSLLTKAYGLQLQQLVRTPVEVWIHWCETEQEYQRCCICPTLDSSPATWAKALRFRHPNPPHRPRRKIAGRT